MRGLARRTDAVDTSGIRKVFDLAAALENPVNLSIGQPDFRVPDAVAGAAIAAIRAGHTGYTVTQGIEALRDGIRAMIKRTRGYDPEEVIVTAGVSGGLMLATLALVEAGDEVLIPDPFFLSYKQLTKLAGATPVYVDTYPDFRLTAERLEAAVTPRSKALVLNSPANPTGAVTGADDLEAVAEVCRRHDLLVVTDEIYDAYCYDGPHVSITRFLPEALLLGGFSKSHAMTGLRLGYACGPRTILQAMLKLQQISFVCAPAPVQEAGVAALETDTSDEIAVYRRKRDLVYEGLKDHFEVTRPSGAFYIFPKVPSGTDMAFVERAIAKGCLVIPGSVFSTRNTHFRISYTTSDDELARGLDILKSLV